MPTVIPKCPYLQLPGLWTGTESHSGGGESFSPSELLVLPSSWLFGRNFARADGLLSTNLLVPAKKGEKKVANITTFFQVYFNDPSKWGENTTIAFHKTTNY